MVIAISAINTSRVVSDTAEDNDKKRATAALFRKQSTLTSFDQSDQCEEMNGELLERLERLERIFNATQYNVELDDMSLLEVLYNSFTSKVMASVPRTDKECKFSWATGECTPRCRCRMQPTIGDYTFVLLAADSGAGWLCM
jgi:hypothetical protein